MLSLRVELTEVFNVPWVGQRCAVLRSQAEASRPANLVYPKGSLPAGGEFVTSFAVEHASEYEVADLKCPGPDVPLMVALQGLMILGDADGSAPPPLIKQI